METGINKISVGISQCPSDQGQFEDDLFHMEHLPCVCLGVVNLQSSNEDRFLGGKKSEVALKACSYGRRFHAQKISKSSRKGKQGSFRDHCIKSIEWSNRSSETILSFACTNRVERLL